MKLRCQNAEVTSVVTVLVTVVDIFHDILCHMAYVIKCHKMAFYDILWHMIYDIECHTICQYGYQNNLLEQENWSMNTRIIWQEQNLTKNVKN